MAPKSIQRPPPRQKCWKLGAATDHVSVAPTAATMKAPLSLVTSARMCRRQVPVVTKRIPSLPTIEVEPTDVVLTIILSHLVSLFAP